MKKSFQIGERIIGYSRTYKSKGVIVSIEDDGNLIGVKINELDVAS